MAPKMAAVLVATLLAVTLVEDVAAAPTEATSVDDAVTFLQDGEGAAAKLLAEPTPAPSGADYSEAVNKGVQKVVDAQAAAATKHVELVSKNEAQKAASDEKLAKNKKTIEDKEKEAKTANQEAKAKQAAISSEGDSKADAKVEEAKEQQRKASAKEQVAERAKEKQNELQEKNDAKAAMAEQKSTDAERSEKARVQSEQVEMDAKAEKRSLITDKAKLQAQVNALTEKVANAEKKGAQKTIAGFPTKYGDLQSKYSDLEEKYMAQQNQIRACAGDKKSLDSARKQLDDVPKIKAHMVAQLVSKLKEARALIIKAKESVVKAKGGDASQGAIDEVKAADQRIINQYSEKAHEYQRAERREEQRANAAESAIGPKANELASKAERQGNVKIKSMQSEVERINNRDHELRNKNSADERKIQGLEAASANSHMDGVSMRKFNAVKEGLEHKMRVVQRAESREQERAEHDITVANARADKYSAKFKSQAQGVDPSEYNRALSKARSEEEQIQTMKSRFAQQMAAEKKHASQEVRAAEEKAKGVESEMAAHAKQQLLEATGAKAAEDSAALARRRSTDSKLNKLLASIQAPAPIPGQTDDVIPASMQEALTNNKSEDVKELESNIAQGLKHENVNTVEEARKAQSEVKVAELQSQLAYKKAALASVEAQNAEKRRVEAASALRKATAAQSIAKVQEATTSAELLKIKNELAQEGDVDAAKKLRTRLDYQVTAVSEAKGKYARAAAKTKAAMDKVHDAGDRVLEAKEEAAQAKVEMAKGVALVRTAKVKAAKVEMQKAGETVKNAQAGRVQVEAALEAALMSRTAAGQAKATQLKVMLARIDSVIATAQTAMDQHRETLSEDEAEAAKSASNAKLFKAEETVSAEGDKDKMQRDMDQLEKATDSELSGHMPSIAADKPWSPEATSDRLQKALESDLKASTAAPAMKNELRDVLKAQIASVMANNKGKSSDELKAILKTKLKETLHKKIAEMKKKAAPKGEEKSDEEPSEEEEEEHKGKDFDTLSKSHEALKKKFDAMQKDLHAVIKKKDAAAAAAKADVMAHSKAVVAEKDEDSPAGRAMVASSAKAAKEAVAAAKKAAQEEAKDNAEIKKLSTEMNDTDKDMKKTYQAAVGAKEEEAKKAKKEEKKKITISPEDKANASKAEAHLLRTEEAAQQAQERMGSVTAQQNKLVMEAEARKNREIAAAGTAKTNSEARAANEKTNADQKAKAAAYSADRDAETAAANVKTAQSPGAASAAVKAAETAERGAQAADAKKNEALTADAAQEAAIDATASKEASVAKANAERNFALVKQNAENAIEAEKAKANDAQRAVSTAQKAADEANAYADQDGEDTDSEIERLKDSLKNTKDVNKMVAIFDKIEKLKTTQNGKPVAENAAAITKIRVYKAKESARKSTLNANERAEKKIAKNTRDSDALAEQAIQRASNAEQASNERNRKAIDQVKDEEGKKTAKAQAEADKLAGSLMKFMNVAHDKVFANEYNAQKAAQEESAKAKAALEKAQDDHTQAKLAHNVASTKEAAAAEKMSGVLKRISADPSDKGELIKLAGEAQAAKAEVVSSRVATQAAAQNLAEKQQVLVKAQSDSSAADKRAAEEDAKVAKEGKANAKEAEGVALR